MYLSVERQRRAGQHSNMWYHYQLNCLIKKYPAHMQFPDQDNLSTQLSSLGKCFRPLHRSLSLGMPLIFLPGEAVIYLAEVSHTCFSFRFSTFRYSLIFDVRRYSPTLFYLHVLRNLFSCVRCRKGTPRGLHNCPFQDKA